MLVHDLVQLDRAGEVGAERLLHHYPCVGGLPGTRDALGDAAEQRRRDLEVEQGALRVTHRLGHRLVGRGVVQVAVNVLEQAKQLPGGVAGRIHLVEPERVLRVLAEPIEAPAALGHADHGDFQYAALDQADQGGKCLQFGEVPGRTEDDERIHLVSHVSAPLMAGASLAPSLALAWPAPPAGPPASVRVGSRAMILIVAGVAGSGKTTVGKLIASKLGWDFADGDDFHSAANIAKMRSGTPLTDSDRFPWLDRIGAWMDEETAAGKSTVIACSGLACRYRDALLNKRPEARVVFLEVSREEA